MRSLYGFCDECGRADLLHLTKIRETLFLWVCPSCARFPKSKTTRKKTFYSSQFACLLNKRFESEGNSNQSTLKKLFWIISLASGRHRTHEQFQTEEVKERPKIHQRENWEVEKVRIYARASHHHACRNRADCEKIEDIHNRRNQGKLEVKPVKALDNIPCEIPRIQAN